MSSFFQQQSALVDSLLYSVRSYRDPQKVKKDVLDCLARFPSLQPLAGVLNPPSQIIYLSGTIPIIYSGASYNIPVSIWVTDAYPYAPPVPYVVPTPDMVIKPRHQHVDSNGVCYLPYLSSWNPNTCTIIGTIEALIPVFSKDPPVRSTGTPARTTSSPSFPSPPLPHKYPPQPNTGGSVLPWGTTAPSPAMTGYPQSSPYPPNPTMTGGYPSNASPYPMNGTGYGNYPPQNHPYEDPSIVAKRNSIQAITEKTQTRLHEFVSQCTKEMDELFTKNSQLEDRIQYSEKEKVRLLSEKNKVDMDMEATTRNFEEISRWLESNDSVNIQVDIDAVTDPQDPLTKQLLVNVAEDATIEDVMYYLEKKLNKGDIELEFYLKNMRTLSVEQFLKRATIKKIHEARR